MLHPFCSNGCDSLHYLNVSWCTNITDEGLEAVSRGCKNLQHFMCRGCEQVSCVRDMVEVIFSDIR